ncbi:MAG: Radical SAM domain protein [Thermotoga sp. 50_1627]|uniref:TIGR03960 family B12-binding radical SAM protein n=1 Tax=Pseudothermotoga sp. TaxID=2033661 RepID=UPI00076D1A7A|nr:MAG: Radical SAM domain protein [Thermotoga sp. 50_64]KUK25676.1 MAG: Radical SAM domain protein [Thermotoga sp. 50_1627]MBC7115589.1 TIGR03960 family B12-binding radical SAM protein [Pseudothermotoga sp.]MDK2923609.1 hypothetical protein [Pseudothermotoga sp.]HBT39993.1 TIGR03960 family B12-binding radical SAM protein [Pseudothermotoga sp.]
MILKMLHEILDRVEKPARYIGGEYNQTVKDPSSVKLRVGLLFPDVYEVGMSNLGLAIIYDVLNDMQNVWAERIFMPWVDMMNMMKDRNLPLFTIESKTAVKDLDLLGVSLQHELLYTNVLHALDLAKIPLLAEERTDTDPIVIAGGPCTVNPEPIARIFDAMVVGDGEGIAREIAQVLIETKGMKRHERLKVLSKMEGVYVPAFYDGSTPPRPLVQGAPEKVRRRIEPVLVRKLAKRIVPHMQLVHDRISVEIMRGCTRGCRFCQAGFIYRPVREKLSTEVLDEILNALTCTGYEEVGLLSLSSADHTAISSMAEELKKVSDIKTISVSIPSTRLDAFGVMLANNVGGARRTGLTFAPEAGTQRLRNVINKNVSEEDFVRALQLARDSGWRRVKLYFMIGLPTETDEDLRGIVSMSKVAKQIGFDLVTLSVAMFIPKPHTPFQFAEQKGPEYFEHARKILLQAKRFAKIDFHDPKMSLIEGILSRGDRKTFSTVLDAYRLGACFDSWQNLFDYQKWSKALETNGIDVKQQLRARTLDEPLPWDHIDTGVDRAFLAKEFEKALRGETTPDCRWACQACGVCNSTVKNVLERHVAQTS